MHAVEPVEAGLVERSDGIRIAYEVFGAGDPTIVLLPSAPIVHSRQWKGQVPYLSRRHRVVTFDGRGNGRSDRPADPEAYLDARVVGDIDAVMDTTETAAAVLVGLGGDGVWKSILLAAARPERVLGIVHSHRACRSCRRRTGGVPTGRSMTSCRRTKAGPR